MQRTAFVLMLLPTLASAEESPLNQCHSLTNNEERLVCYDTASGYAATIAPAPSEAEADEPAAISQWHHEEEKSQLEDRTDIWLVVASENTQPNQIGQPENANFVLRCMDNTTSAFVIFNNYTSDNQSVKFRTDDDPVEKVWMEVMNGGEGIGIWSGGKAIPFIKGLFEKNKLVVAYDSYSNHNLEFVFNVTGLQDEIGKLSETCAW